MKRLGQVLFLLLAYSSSAFSEEAPEQPADHNTTLLDQENILIQPDITKDFLTSVNPAPLPSRKNSFLAVGLSFVYPGLGHLYLGENKTAGSLITANTVGLNNILLSNRDKSNSKYFSYASLLGADTQWSYGIYAAYRDLRSYNQQFGYKYAMPEDSYLDLRSAPFSWSVIKKPEVWGGYLGSLVAAGVTLYFFQKKVKKLVSLDLKINPLQFIYPISAFSIGISEEAFFRGFLQPILSEYLSPIGGIMASSFSFGMAHILNAIFMPIPIKVAYLTYCIPLITSFGFYFGWLAQKNTSLKECVALHSWYDFTLFALTSSTFSSAISKSPEISFSYSFSF